MVFLSPNRPNVVPIQQTMVVMAQETMYNTQMPNQLKTTTITTIARQTVPNGPRTDRSSAEGKFGWATFMDTPVPYLMRSDKKYISLYMLQQIFNMFDQYFTNELYNYFIFESFPMTEVEAKLLNEINHVHSNNSFGNITLTANQKLISLKEAVYLYNFLQFSYEKLIRKSLVSAKVCGFMQINSENSIPYVWYRGKRYVPLFYLDGDSQYLTDNALVLTGYPLAYLKLCCRIHGVEKPVYKDNSITVVDLELVKKFFASGTPFEDCWPAQHKAQCLLRQNPPVQQGNATKSVQASNTGHRTSPGTITNRNRPLYSATKRKLVKITPNYPTPPPPKVPNTRGTNPIQLPDYGYPEGTSPYSISKQYIGGKYLNVCINMMPFEFAKKLVTIEEFMGVYQIPDDMFLKIIGEFRCNIYLPNAYQRQLLASRNVHYTAGLFQADDLVKRINDTNNGSSH